MIKETKIAIVFLIVLALSGSRVSAEVITIEITAEITGMDDRDGLLEGMVNVGDIITGSYTYDPSTEDSNPLETVGNYHHYSPPCGISLTAGGFVFQTNTENVNFLVVIGNNHMYSSWDNYGVGSYNNLMLYNGVYINLVSWGLQDSSGTALSSDALPTLPPVLEDWDYNQLTIEGSFDGGCPMVLLGARVTSAVPEPATVLLFGLGALALLRKR